MGLSRRNFLKSTTYAALLTATYPGLSLATASTQKRFVTIILRGGMDGLTAVPPYADPEYSRTRPHIAIDLPGRENGALDLNGYFGLHPNLASLSGNYHAGELAFLPAVSSPYRKRSHFDAQNVLENGTSDPFKVRTGWLNRSLNIIDADTSRLGLAVGQGLPLIMQGQSSVQTWAPSVLPEVENDFLERVMQLYAKDPVFESALTQAMKSSALTSNVMAGPGTKKKRRKADLKTLAEAAGKLLAEPDGPRIATIDFGGWDTHAGQPGRLGNKLKDLDKGLATLKENLGTTWKDTVVVAVSEFGRTVAENGTRGTDHGTGGLALILGGAVRGGKFYGKWPGLAEHHQYQGRDLAPANDMRSLFKTVLHDHLGVSENSLEDIIFPGSKKAKLIEGLIRKT